ncbi:MAG: KdsC family phosphatase [Phycisphaerales bacterium]
MPATPASITLLALDVDGVLTDGSIVIDDDGRETKRFNVRDGFGIALWRKLGFTVAIITGRKSLVVEHRARELGIDPVIQGSTDKSASLDEVLARTGIAAANAAFVGDDWPDIPAMRRVGYPIAVGDADPRVKAIARYVTTLPGGRGAVREAIEHLLTLQGLMERAVRLYDA